MLHISKNISKDNFDQIFILSSVQIVICVLFLVFYSSSEMSEAEFYRREARRARKRLERSRTCIESRSRALRALRESEGQASGSRGRAPCGSGYVYITSTYEHLILVLCHMWLGNLVFIIVITDFLILLKG